MKYIWRLAHGGDVQPIVQLAQRHFEAEIDNIFKPEPVIYSRNIMLAIVNQFYGPNTNLVWVCESEQKIIAYTWAINGERAAWSDDSMIVVRMAHVEMDLPIRTRLHIVSDMITKWEEWARQCGTPIICSTTMRRDQDGFLKLHQRHGYDVRGSYAYKRI